MIARTRRILDFRFSILDWRNRRVSPDPKSKIQNPRSLWFVSASGQSFVETTVFLLAVASALVIFFTFVRNAVSSRIKIGSDTFGHGLLHDEN